MSGEREKNNRERGKDKEIKRGLKASHLLFYVISLSLSLSLSLTLSSSASTLLERKGHVYMTLIRICTQHRTHIGLRIHALTHTDTHTHTHTHTHSRCHSYLP